MVIERPKPIAEQVEIILRGKIRDGEFPPGSRLPSESDLASQFGVSRATVRTVLATLEAERMITRRQGDGTYINKRVMEINTRMGDEWDFKYMIEDSGRTPQIKPVRVEIRTANNQEQAALEINKGDQVLSLLRLFLADSQPVIYSENILPAAFCTSPGPYDVTQPIRKILMDYCHQEIAYSISDLSATLPSPEVMEALSLSPDKPLLKFTDLFFNDKDQPLVFGLNYYNDKALRLRVTRSWG
jgi:GntR family transcriptional regulator